MQTFFGWQKYESNRREGCITISKHASQVSVFEGRGLGESANPNLKHLREFHLQGLGKSLVHVLDSLPTSRGPGLQLAGMRLESGER